MAIRTVNVSSNSLFIVLFIIFLCFVYCLYLYGIEEDEAGMDSDSSCYCEEPFYFAKEPSSRPRRSNETKNGERKSSDKLKN